MEVSDGKWVPFSELRGAVCSRAGASLAGLCCSLAGTLGSSGSALEMPDGNAKLGEGRAVFVMGSNLPGTGGAGTRSQCCHPLGTAQGHSHRSLPVLLVAWKNHMVHRENLLLLIFPLACVLLHAVVFKDFFHSLNSAFSRHMLPAIGLGCVLVLSHFQTGSCLKFLLLAVGLGAHFCPLLA